MTQSIEVLSIAAVSLGLGHTLLGPDHYIPFVAMSRAGRWSLRKTLVVTVLCGLGHVASSAVLGVLGMVLGVAVLKLNVVEGYRGDVAAWLMLAFGLVYFSWGVRRAIRGQPHTHWHAHADGRLHAHKHVHHSDHLHAHAAENVPAPTAAESEDAIAAGENDAGRSGRMTPWILFTVFLFGPCEPLIPLLMYPAAEGAGWAVIWVTVLFAAATLAAMTAVVCAMYVGMARFRFERFERYSHALAGFAVMACGVAIIAGL
jgi:ABC-type nickel/cobalt efflux system permease component RcnA